MFDEIRQFKIENVADECRRSFPVPLYVRYFILNLSFYKEQDGNIAMDDRRGNDKGTLIGSDKYMSVRMYVRIRKRFLFIKVEGIKEAHAFCAGNHLAPNPPPPQALLYVLRITYFFCCGYMHADRKRGVLGVEPKKTTAKTRGPSLIYTVSFMYLEKILIYKNSLHMLGITHYTKTIDLIFKAMWAYFLL
jgi:hypothetical protein